MKITVSKHSGFCFGVKRAVSLTEKRLKKGKRIYSLGPLIHNRWVVSELSRKGLKIIEDLDRIKKGSCIIPSHGIDPSKIKKQKAVSFIDTTCPFVFKAQTLVKKLVNSGYEALILGDKNHPEVKGLVGISKGKARVLRGEREAASLHPKKNKISLISQTTQSLENFIAVSSKLVGKKFQEFRIFNTICKDVIERQAEARKIAKKSDLILVIGGRNSANTKGLVQICRFFAKTHHIESERDLRKVWLRNVKRVGIVTGASTPGEFIGRVKRRIKEELN